MQPVSGVAPALAGWRNVPVRGGTASANGCWARDADSQPQQSPARSVTGAQAASALALSSTVAEVRDATALVAGLARLAEHEEDSKAFGGRDDHHNSAGARERGRWLRWCRSVVLTLERAGQLLGMVSGSEAHQRSLRAVID